MADAAADPPISRRRALGWLGAAGAAALAAACSKSSSDSAAATSSTSPSSAVQPTTTMSSAAEPAPACVLTPEMTEGPFFIDGEAVRADITEGKPGAPLHLVLTVVDATTCKPISG